MNNSAMLSVPQMVLIGAAGRNSGKTTLACQLIETWKSVLPVYAVKVIAIDHANGACQRGQAGCGICTSLQGSYELVEETGEHPEKDTAQMLAAGAADAFLLKCLKSAMREAICYVLERIPREAILIVESNTLRKHLVPGAFLFTQHLDSAVMKPSAREVCGSADLLLSPGGMAAGAICIQIQPNGSVCVKPAIHRPIVMRKGLDHVNHVIA